MNNLIKLVSRDSNSNSVNTVASTSSMPPSLMPQHVAVGNWKQYRAYTTNNRLTLNERRAACWSVLGTRMRKVPKHSTVFTPEFLTQLAADNELRRKTVWPYFWRIATLYREIEQLETAS